MVSLPTGPRCGLVDQATNTALTDSGPFPLDRPVSEYHDYLQARGPRFDTAGRVTPDGVFSATSGWNFGGSGHFSIDARIVSAETPDGSTVTDPVVGRAVDMWGHYNPYLATTFNRARVFDIDPASNWTTALMVGQFGFGRQGRSHEVGYMLIGNVHGFHPPRWHNFRHILDVGDHFLASEFRRSVVYQFVVAKEDGLHWLDEAEVSPVVGLLRSVVDSDAVGGLVVQFALSNMSTPVVPGPSRWDLRGTIAPWMPDELRTYPAGRLLTPRALARQGLVAVLHNLTVDVGLDRVTFNMINAVPVTSRAEEAGPGPSHRLGPPVDAGDLELRTAQTGRLVAVVPATAYRGNDFALTSGIVTVPVAAPGPVPVDEPLCLVGTAPGGKRMVLLYEEEINLQVDDACLILEHPRGDDDHDQDVEVLVRSFVRGRPGPVDTVRVRQFFNPRALPRDPAATSPEARCEDVTIVRFRPGRLRDSGDFAPACVINTDHTGRGWFTMRGAQAGSARVLLVTEAGDLPCAVDLPGSATVGYDNDDALGYWSGAGSLAVRVLPDDWHLEDVPTDEVNFDVVYREVFAFYELLYSFMKAEVFSLADRFRVETHPRLIWNMCDPANKMKTYYMPPSRDMSESKARLLLKYLRAKHAEHQPPSTVRASRPASQGITNRTELIRALRHAVKIELAVMLQYLYAVYSIPTYGAGLEYVCRGEWTREQLRLICGDGGETLDNGIRGRLLSVAREEMIHFLTVNNILMAIGEPFYVPAVDFGTVNNELPVPLDFSLEPLGLGSLQRFIAIEQPERLVTDVRRGEITGYDVPQEGLTYHSLSELYAAIREGLQRVPDLFMVDRGRGGGEHHLFMRESVNLLHPDYQLEVDDLASALFAIDFITEQGEGGVLTTVIPPEESHFDTFLRISDLLMAEHLKASAGRRAPWSPAYPVVRNPTLDPGSQVKELVTAPEAREVMTLFNRSYFMMFQLMVLHFGQRPDASLRRSDLMNAALEVMTGMMRPLAELLVTLPSGRRGKTAGPSFELESIPGWMGRSDVAMRSVSLRFQHLAEACRKCDLVPDSVTATSAYLGRYFGSQAD
ncbi:VioB-polyketide synthase [Carbonactinospora thermoautotrophica]|uniref:VioB-polyketide synthase n=1 Tax=Carbonactinospora thermoautotrophica TaxID=1469144 RepID=A0A132MSM8_9ACTN|nr:VioB-polyketide synthase [Carbonactinospora thermoautotrophica]